MCVLLLWEKISKLRESFWKSSFAILNIKELFVKLLHYEVGTTLSCLGQLSTLPSRLRRDICADSTTIVLNVTSSDVCFHPFLSLIFSFTSMIIAIEQVEKFLFKCRSITILEDWLKSCYFAWVKLFLVFEKWLVFICHIRCFSDNFNTTIVIAVTTTTRLSIEAPFISKTRSDRIFPISFSLLLFFGVEARNCMQ